MGAKLRVTCAKCGKSHPGAVVDVGESNASAITVAAETDDQGIPAPRGLVAYIRANSENSNNLRDSVITRRDGARPRSWGVPTPLAEDLPSFRASAQKLSAERVPSPAGLVAYVRDAAVRGGR